MGAWGVKLNQNDLYADIRDFYTALLRYGMSDEEALTHTLRELTAYENDPEERELFWFSLADAMWKLGRLTDNVKWTDLINYNYVKDISNYEELEKKIKEFSKEIDFDQFLPIWKSEAPF